MAKGDFSKEHSVTVTKNINTPDLEGTMSKIENFGNIDDLRNIRQNQIKKDEEAVSQSSTLYKEVQQRHPESGENSVADPYGLNLIPAVQDMFEREMTQAYEITIKNTLRKVPTSNIYRSSINQLDLNSKITIQNSKNVQKKTVFQIDPRIKLQNRKTLYKTKEANFHKRTKSVGQEAATERPKDEAEPVSGEFTILQPLKFDTFDL